MKLGERKYTQDEGPAQEPWTEAPGKSPRAADGKTGAQDAPRRRGVRGTDAGESACETPEAPEYHMLRLFTGVRVLGIIVAFCIAMHLYQFWFKMQFNEITGILPEVNPHDGYALIAETLGNPIMAIIYLVWFVAIWFHLTHGFWSAIQTLGWNNKIWLSRWKCISYIYTTVLCLGFAVVAIYFGFKA